MPERKGRSGGLGPLGGHPGFSLVELLIAIAVILIIAAIAIPNFMRSKMRANEVAAVQNARDVTTAEVVYSTTYGIGFSSSLAKLGPAAGGSILADANNAALIDEVLATATKSGYTFSYVATDVDGDGRMDVFTLNADPLSPGITGQRYFFTDQTIVIHFSTTAPATANDPPIS
ncbi:MAG TPA: prepilin-type N-terminal cleavage/methylation domain-containing protein [Candidatus Acidoferrales bacterium]|nr:prepilin-type N-terminal cleavage/methylation domain-containing protein [Candidatus Acidoferrales bacterium]